MSSLRLIAVYSASLLLLLLGCSVAFAQESSKQESGSSSHASSKASTHSSNGSAGGAHSLSTNANAGGGHASSGSVSGTHSSSGVNANDYAQSSEASHNGAANESRPQAASSSAQSEIDRFRVTRDYTPRLYGNAQVKHHYYPPSNGSQMINQPGAYAAQSMQPNQPQYGSVNTFAPPPPMMQAQGNYIWEQSANGGYYDATGQIPNLVTGDQLYRYGGKFPDGSAVPSTPVVCNFQGHVYFPYVVKR